MAKKQNDKLVNSEQIERIEKLAHEYYDGNQKKNAAAKIERNATKALETELLNYGENVTVKINDHMYLEMGYMDDEKEEIDPKKFFEEYPEMFWQIVSVPKTVVVAKLGEMVAAKTARVVKTRGFKINKHKSDPRSQ